MTQALALLDLYWTMGSWREEEGQENKGRFIRLTLTLLSIRPSSEEVPGALKGPMRSESRVGRALGSISTFLGLGGTKEGKTVVQMNGMELWTRAWEMGSVTLRRMGAKEDLGQWCWLMRMVDRASRASYKAMGWQEAWKELKGKNETGLFTFLAWRILEQAIHRGSLLLLARSSPLQQQGDDGGREGTGESKVIEMVDDALQGLSRLPSFPGLPGRLLCLRACVSYVQGDVHGFGQALALLIRIPQIQDRSITQEKMTLLRAYVKALCHIALVGQMTNGKVKGKGVDQAVDQSIRYMEKRVQTDPLGFFLGWMLVEAGLSLGPRMDRSIRPLAIQMRRALPRWLHEAEEEEEGSGLEGGEVHRMGAELQALCRR